VLPGPIGGTVSMKAWQWFLAVVCGVVVILGGIVFYQIHDVRVEQITDDLWIAYGAGGNVGILRTGDGTVIVDTMTFTYQGTRIREVAEALTGEPVRVIVNTHYHTDHTHGNPAFAAGTRVVSTYRTLHHLQQTDAEYFSGPAAALLPNETFEDTIEVAIGDKTLHLMHPGRGHTDGDLVVRFVEDDTLHAGDLYFNRHYPNIDLEAGGSAQLWGDTLDTVMTLPFSHVIPGHGPLSDRDGLRQFQRFIRQLAAIGRDAKANGLSLEETIATDALTEDAAYTEVRVVVPVGLDRKFVLRRAWEETHGAFERRP